MAAAGTDIYTGGTIIAPFIVYGIQEFQYDQLTNTKPSSIYPQDAVFIQVDETERLMTDEEYESWVVYCVQYINDHPTEP
jgi:hypothetical protein